MTDPFEHDAGAYVLGALEPAERARFETHIKACTGCAARVNDVADLPALLGVLSSGEVAAGLESPPDALLPALLRSASRRRVRARALLVGVAAVAASALVALAVVLGRGSSTPAPGGPELAMRAVPGAPVSASVRLVSERWGTQVRVHCRYPGAGPESHDWTYLLVLYDRAGRVQPVGSWILGPGDDATFTAATALTPAQIGRVAIQLLPGHQTVLTLST